MDEDSLLEIIEGTGPAERIKTLRGVYSRLGDAQERFCRRFGISCRRGCGCCCERFVPDMGESESEYLAFGLIAEGREEYAERSASEAQSNGACPFYVADREEHCSIYKYRPLICRLFGASASRDKSGRAVFGGCRWAPEMKVPADELEKAGADTVIMSDYGLMLEECDAGNTERYPISEALRRSSDKLRLLISLGGENSPEK